MHIQDWTARQQLLTATEKKLESWEGM